MSARAEIADAKFVEGYNCAQSVLFSFSDQTKLAHGLALQLACGFGAGMGRKGEVCGAFTGGLMVLGALFGRGENETSRATEEVYEKTRILYARFSALQGSCLCRELLNGCDLTTPEGQKYFKDNDCLNAICRPCVRDAVEIVESLL
ncbi:MAG: C-GCAxxG-C-C family protein [Smithellaceae bacterium]